MKEPLMHIEFKERKQQKGVEHNLMNPMEDIEDEAVDAFEVEEEAILSAITVDILDTWQEIVNNLQNNIETTVRLMIMQ